MIHVHCMGWIEKGYFPEINVLKYNYANIFNLLVIKDGDILDTKNEIDIKEFTNYYA